MDDESYMIDGGGGRHHLLPGAGLDDLLNDVGNDGLSVAQAEATFNQERSLVAKISRQDLEDRYLRLLEENIVIKKHALKQVNKIGTCRFLFRRLKHAIILNQKNDIKAHVKNCTNINNI